MNLERRIERLANLAWQGGVNGVSDVTDAEKQLTQSIVTDVTALVEAAWRMADYVDGERSGADWEEDDVVTGVRSALAAFEGIPNA